LPDLTFGGGAWETTLTITVKPIITLPGAMVFIVRDLIKKKNYPIEMNSEIK
jgi:hypothetical protein